MFDLASLFYGMIIGFVVGGVMGIWMVIWWIEEKHGITLIHLGNGKVDLWKR